MLRGGYWVILKCWRGGGKTVRMPFISLPWLFRFSLPFFFSLTVHLGTLEQSPSLKQRQVVSFRFKLLGTELSHQTPGVPVYEVARSHIFTPNPLKAVNNPSVPTHQWLIVQSLHSQRVTLKWIPHYFNSPSVSTSRWFLFTLLFSHLSLEHLCIINLKKILHRS